MPTISPRTLPANNLILDGELVAIDGKGKPSFYELPNELKVRVKARLVYCAFDLLYLDGKDLRTLQQKPLHDQISYVLQENVLFSDSVRQNIAYGRQDATDAEIVRAAELANAHEFISRLPEGYDTVLGERGVTLSGGQRQRIAIARAIIRDTPILILDEPSSGLDALSEELVFEAIDRLIEGRTTIVIAHRFSTVRRASTILVVQDGRIVESGKHEQLLAAGGLYAQLYEVQFRCADALPEPVLIGSAVTA